MQIALNKTFKNYSTFKCFEFVIYSATIIVSLLLLWCSNSNLQWSEDSFHWNVAAAWRVPAFSVMICQIFTLVFSLERIYNTNSKVKYGTINYIIEDLLHSCIRWKVFISIARGCISRGKMTEIRSFPSGATKANCMSTINIHLNYI